MACEKTCAVVALLGMLAPSLAAADTSANHSPAAYERHVRELKKKLPGDDFTIVVEKPFVVIGDEKPDKVRHRAKHTVGWAVEKLKAAYFDKDPDEILDIWLFKDKESYETNAKRLFRVKPDTPFGYYSSADKALVMNISTGGGTLVHEIVHPFMAANFPGCPAWLNEGLGSLYEQSDERDGRIVGLTNWRLPDLQKAIRAKKLPSFKTLCAMTDEEFYEKDKGTNYAQARYLCYWLQEQGLLRKFYHAFHAARSEDPGGYKTLCKTIARDDMEHVRQEWEDFVLKLRFR
jgi:hypothetical protein